MAEKTFTIKKMYAKQIYHKGQKYEIRPVQNKYVGLKIPMLVGWHWYKRRRLLTAFFQSRSLSRWRKFFLDQAWRMP